jgi:hypothetical protein
MKAILMLLFLLGTQTGFTKESTLPKGCKALKVQGNSVTVHSEKKSLVFIHNLMAVDLWMTHPVADPSTSAGWSSQVHSKKWSALSLGKGPFVLNCIESKPGHEQEVPCEGAIAVCQWNKVKFPRGTKGAFWVAEDMSLSGLTAAVGARGYVLPE